MLKFSRVTGEPVSQTEAILLAECPPFDAWPIDRQVQDFLDQEKWSVADVRRNAYVVYAHKPGSAAFTLAKPISMGLTLWLEETLARLTPRARELLGITAWKTIPRSGLFWVEVDWDEFRWGPLRGDIGGWCEPLISALADLRYDGVIHGGIEPSSLVVDEKNRNLRFKHFPIAHLIAAWRGQLVQGLGELVGNPLYIAPELAAGEAPDSLSDVYSLGASLLCLLRSARPHEERAPYLGSPGAERRLTLMLDDWISPGTTAPPLVVGMLEADRRLRERVITHYSRPPLASSEASDDLPLCTEQAMEAYLEERLLAAGLALPFGHSADSALRIVAERLKEVAPELLHGGNPRPRKRERP